MEQLDSKAGEWAAEASGRAAASAAEAERALTVRIEALEAKLVEASAQAERRQAAEKRIADEAGKLDARSRRQELKLARQERDKRSAVAERKLGERGDQIAARLEAGAAEAERRASRIADRGRSEAETALREAGAQMATQLRGQLERELREAAEAIRGGLDAAAARSAGSLEAQVVEAASLKLAADAERRATELMRAVDEASARLDRAESRTADAEARIESAEEHLRDALAGAEQQAQRRLLEAADAAYERIEAADSAQEREARVRAAAESAERESARRVREAEERLLEVLERADAAERQLAERARLASDQLQICRPHQDVKHAVVEARHAALPELQPRAGRRGDGVGEVGLVADQQDLFAPGRNCFEIEAAAGERVLGLGLDAELAACDPGGVHRPDLGARQTCVELDAERGECAARPLGLALALRGQGTGCVGVAVLSVAVAQQPDHRAILVRLAAGAECDRAPNWYTFINPRKTDGCLLTPQRCSPRARDPARGRPDA